MNRLKVERRAQVVRCLVEGMSIRSTTRITGVAKNTIIRLILELGKRWRAFQDKVFTNLPCRRIQCDEIWSFCNTKEKNLPKDHPPILGVGDLWTWTAICPDTKIVPYWLVGRRDSFHAQMFMNNLAQRFSQRIQITTDGFKPYFDAVPEAFQRNVDFAMTIKQYGEPLETRKTAVCIGQQKYWVTGQPDEAYISTSLCERQNLTMRMGLRRMTRKTNAFSKKAENHIAATSVYFMHYNFVRVHQTLKMTPAEAAGLIERGMAIEEIV